MTNKKKLDHIFADMIIVLEPESFSNFLAFAYGALSKAATDSAVETIKNKKQEFIDVDEQSKKTKESEEK